jgi:hypothetical protein
MPIMALTAALGASLCWAGKRDGWPSKLLSSNSGETRRRSDSTMSRTTCAGRWRSPNWRQPRCRTTMIGAPTTPAGRRGACIRVAAPKT